MTFSDCGRNTRTGNQSQRLGRRQVLAVFRVHPTAAGQEPLTADGTAVGGSHRGLLSRFKQIGGLIARVYSVYSRVTHHGIALATQITKHGKRGYKQGGTASSVWGTILKENVPFAARAATVVTSATTVPFARHNTRHRDQGHREEVAP